MFEPPGIRDIRNARHTRNCRRGPRRRQSDCVMGMIASRGDFGTKIRQTTFALGDKAGSREVFLALRGPRTLKMRMEHFDRAGREIAIWLSAKPQVKTVLHPAFETRPGHAHWRRTSLGTLGCLGWFSTPALTSGFVPSSTRCTISGSASAGADMSSHILPAKPARTANTWPEDGQMVRINIGLEDLETVKADLTAALPLLNS